MLQNADLSDKAETASGGYRIRLMFVLTRFFFYCATLYSAICGVVVCPCVRRSVRMFTYESKSKCTWPVIVTVVLKLNNLKYNTSGVILSMQDATVFQKLVGI